MDENRITVWMEHGGEEQSRQVPVLSGHNTSVLHCGVQDSVVVAQGISCPVACVVLAPRPEMELVFPASEGGFFTTGPPGKSSSLELVAVFIYPLVIYGLPLEESYDQPR